MDIRQLKYFIAIAEERQITAAAKKLNMTQPPLSQQLGLMESELGVKLVSREGRAFELTDSGKALYENAMKIVELMEESNAQVKEIGSGIRGRLLIGVNTLSYYKLPEALIEFQKLYPGVTYKVQQNESGQLCKLLRERMIELAVVRLPVDLRDFSILYFKPEKFYFLTSEKMRTLSEKVSYSQIKDLPLVLPSTEGLGLYSEIVNQFSKRHLRPNIICECSDIVALLELVLNGFGSTIVPESTLRVHRGYDLKAFEIDDDSFTETSGLIWLKDRYLSKVSRNFIDLMGKNV